MKKNQKGVLFMKHRVVRTRSDCVPRLEDASCCRDI